MLVAKGKEKREMKRLQIGRSDSKQQTKAKSLKEVIQQWNLLNPEGAIPVRLVKLAPRLNTLEGKTVGFRANGKQNSDHFLNRIAELLTKQLKDVKIIKLWEVVPSSFDYPLKPEDIQKIAQLKPDIIIGSQGD